MQQQSIPLEKPFEMFVFVEGRNVLFTLSSEHKIIGSLAGGLFILLRRSHKNERLFKSLTRPVPCHKVSICF